MKYSPIAIAIAQHSSCAFNRFANTKAMYLHNAFSMIQIFIANVGNNICAFHFEYMHIELK